MKKTTSCGSIPYRIVAGSPEILLVRPWKDRDVWGIPKGHVDPGETHEQCAIRETREESGLEVELEDCLPECKVDFKGEKKRVITWIARQVGGELRPQDPDGEIVDVRWFPVDALPRLHVYQAPVINAAVALARKKAIWA